VDEIELDQAGVQEPAIMRMVTELRVLYTRGLSSESEQLSASEDGPCSMAFI
jgi:hypothetical protein